MNRLISRPTALTFAGLGIGIAGLIVQATAEPATFADAQAAFGVPFPPGILFVLGAAIITLATVRWWWHPLPAVLIAVWIVGFGTATGQLTGRLVSASAGTMLGIGLLVVGLVGAAVAGVVAMTTGRRAAATRS